MALGLKLAREIGDESIPNTQTTASEDYAEQPINRTVAYPGKMLLTALEAKLITI
jgi:hypothetical protein